ncbi:glucosamine-6-phosphate deaminase [Oscillospiraceae bacterium PP1C4]
MLETQIKKDLLNVKTYSSRKEMGEAAAKDFAALVQRLLETKESIRVIFAAAPSQNEFLEAVCADTEIDFSRIEAFHMDEYIGLHKQAPQRFGNFLKRQIFDRCNFKSVSYIDGQSLRPEQECERYTALLTEHPIDIVCMGIGENGHIAFNDPDVADFNDVQKVKTVALDNVCRQQQVNDGCFMTLDDVPKTAVTLTIPMLMNAEFHLCIVPAKTKAQAVQNTLLGEISASCPASVLRKAKNAVLYLDLDSGSLI